MVVNLQEPLALTEIIERINAEGGNPKIGQVSDVILRRMDASSSNLEQVLTAAFNSPEIEEDFKAGSIRHAAMVMAVAQDMIKKLGLAEEIHDLTVGTIQLPETVAALVAEVKAVAALIADVMSKKGTGYDLPASGILPARHQALSLFDRHYGFPEELHETVLEKSVIGPGGMRLMNDLFVALREWWLVQGIDPEKIHFCAPDNSFGTTWQLTDNNRIGNASGPKLANLDRIPVRPENGLHITADDVNAFYDQHEGEEIATVWYLTPLGNPSGTKIDPAQLHDSLNAIALRDPKAVIILDMVYVRTLSEEEARELLQAVWSSNAVGQILFLESLSKTHGMCSSRAGMVFTGNKDNQNKVPFVDGKPIKPEDIKEGDKVSWETPFSWFRKKNMEVSAGNGESKDALFAALGAMKPEEIALFDELHEFWAAELEGLYDYLMNNSDFNHLFDQQIHIQVDNLENPGGLYLFLKVKPGVAFNEVVIATKCFGVPTPMLTGNGEEKELYIRYAVGRVTKPTFSTFQSSTLLPEDFTMPSTHVTFAKALARFPQAA